VPPVMGKFSKPVEPKPRVVSGRPWKRFVPTQESVDAAHSGQAQDRLRFERILGEQRLAIDNFEFTKRAEDSASSPCLRVKGGSVLVPTSNNPHQRNKLEARSFSIHQTIADGDGNAQTPQPEAFS
jgi:hypothetical protein